MKCLPGRRRVVKHASIMKKAQDYSHDEDVVLFLQKLNGKNVARVIECVQEYGLGRTGHDVSDCRHG